MKIYLAAPLFTEAERAFNKELKNNLLNRKIHVFSPWDFCDGLSNRDIFIACSSKINDSDIMVAILDGSQVDDGTAWEIGYAYSKGIPIFGIRTDYRKGGEEGLVNCMITHSCVKIYRSLFDFDYDFKKDLENLNLGEKNEHKQR